MGEASRGSWLRVVLRRFDARLERIRVRFLASPSPESPPIEGGELTLRRAADILRGAHNGLTFEVEVCL
jgi:hypothetical protein